MTKRKTYATYDEAIAAGVKPENIRRLTRAERRQRLQAIVRNHKKAKLARKAKQIIEAVK